MAASVQLGRQARRIPGPALTPELREFLDRVVVPALVDAFLAEPVTRKSLARGKVEVGECIRASSEVVE